VLSAAYGGKNRNRRGILNRSRQSACVTTVFSVDEHIDVRAKVTFFRYNSVENARIARLERTECGTYGFARLLVRVDGDDGAPARV